MSTTLNLADRILDTACNLHHLGRSHDAAQLLNRLASWRDLPRDCAEEAHVRLAEIHLEFEQPKQARRHLAIALALEPECAHYHYLMAVALEDDPKCDPRRADGPYRRCLALDPEHAEYQCDYGVYAVQQGRARAGLAALRRAAALAPDDPDMLGRVAAGMRQADRADEAKELLRAALFRNPTISVFATSGRNTNSTSCTLPSRNRASAGRPQPMRRSSFHSASRRNAPRKWGARQSAPTVRPN